MNGNPTEKAEGFAEATQTERAGPSREVDMLRTEEKKLNGLGLDVLGLKSNSETQGQ